MAMFKIISGGIFDLACAWILLIRSYMKYSLFTSVVLVALLSIKAFSYTKLELYPKISISEMERAKFQRSKKELGAIEALKNNEISKSDIAISDQLMGLNKEIASDLKTMDQAKALAKKALYEGIKKNWSSDLEFTALNDIGASSFDQISEHLLKKMNEESHYYGPYSIKGKDYYLFSVANISQVIVSQDLKSARVFIQFDTKSDGNTLQE